MSSRSHVQAAGRRIGVNPSGPGVVCPSCHGSGRAHDDDEDHANRSTPGGA